jgi:excisionase family DNA binding protein
VNPRRNSPAGNSSVAGDRNEWLALGPASKLLGVNESTLRRWADEGSVRSFRTPGGHRRFAATDIERLHQPSSDDSVGATDYQSLGNLAVARIRRRLQQGRRHPAGWYQTVDEASRMRLRPLGRRLVSLAADCLEKRLRGNRLTEEARAIGREYGLELAQDGVSLRDAVEGFTFFRRSLDETTQQLAHNASLNVEDAAAAWEQVAGLADLVLVAMIEAYETRRKPSEPDEARLT